MRLGVHDINARNDEAVQEVKVIRSEKHLDFNQLDGTNDIAILYLERDLDITSKLVLFRQKCHFG